MRDYSKIAPSFWTGDTGRELRRAGLEAQLLGAYLMTSPHANMLGVYYLPIPYISHETAIPLKGASKALQRVFEGGFASYDPVSEVVWVHEMARYQVGEQLNPNDNMVKAVRKEYASLPKCLFLSPFFDRYASAFHLENRREFEAPSKPLRSQDQDQDQEQEQDLGTEARARDSKSAVNGKGSKFVPKDFAVTAELAAWAERECPDVDHAKATAQFRDHEYDEPKHDFVRCWRKWMRNAQGGFGPFKPKQHGFVGQ